MSTLRTDDLQLRVLIDGSPARKELAELAQEEVKVNEQLKGVKKNSDEATAALTRLGEVRGRQAELRKEIGLTGLGLRELQGELAKANAAFRAAGPRGTEQWVQAKLRVDEVKAAMRGLKDEATIQGDAWEKLRGKYRLAEMNLHQLGLEANRLKQIMDAPKTGVHEYQRLSTELNAVNGRMNTLRSGLGPFGRAWESMKGQVMGAVAVLGSFLAGTTLITGIKKLVSGSAELSDAQAEVKRTTQLSNEEVLRLTKNLGQLNTRTARSELLDLAKEAGKLGITGVENVLAFVRAGDKLKVALGEELGDDAITQIGKLNQTFKVGETTGKSMEQQMLSTGSAINSLANASTASGGYLVDFSTRIAGAGTRAGISLQQTLGYGATLDQLGQQSETASTALGRFLIEAYKQTDKYAKIAGLSTEDFTKLLKQDANEALLKTLDGLNGNNAGLATMAGLFDDLGQDGARAVSTLATLASNTKLIREQQDIANKSFKEGTSVITAFDNKNSTLGANLDIIGKRIGAAFVNSSVVQGINSIAAATRNWLDGLHPLSEDLEQERIEMQKTYAQILTYNVGTTERTRLIKELQERYPGYLANIDAETVSNQALGLAVKDLNQQLVSKIVLQKKDEEIQDLLRQQADRQMRVLEEEDNVREKMVRLAEREQLQLKEGVPLLEQARDLYDRISEARRRAGKIDETSVLSQLGSFGHAIEELTVKYSNLNSAQDLSNKLTEERAELMKRLGIVDTGTTPPPPTAAPPDGGGVPGVPPDDKARKAMDQLREQLKAWRQQLLLDALSSDEKEVAQVDAKYADLRKAILANEAHTKADLEALDEAYAQARANAIEDGGEKRLAAQRKADEQLAQQRQDAGDEIWRMSQDGMDQEIIQLLQHLDTLSATLKDGSEEKIAITKYTEKAIADLRDKAAKQELDKQRRIDQQALQQKIANYQAVGSAAAGLNSFLTEITVKDGQKNFEYTQFGKILALIQIASSAAVAVAEATKAAIPGDPYTLAARIAVAVGSVLAAIGSAYAVMNASPPLPPPPAGDSAGPPPTLNNVPLGEHGGVFKGSSHADGGLGVFDNRTGQQVAEVEGGEAWMVLSKRFTEKNADLIPALLNASRSGARVNFLTKEVPRLDYDGVRDAIGQERYANGGIIYKPTTRGTALVNLGAHDDGGTPPWAVELNRNIAGMRADLKEFPRTIKAELVMKQKLRAEAEYDRLKSRNRVSRG